MNVTDGSAALVESDLAHAGLAEAVVFDRDRVLLIRRRDVPVWSLPGGHRDPGETADVSCLREVREETGLTVRIAQPLGFYRRPYWLSGGMAVIYRCEPVTCAEGGGGGRLAPGNREGEARFWPVDALPEPILYWYPPIIRAAYACARRQEAIDCRIDADAVSPTLRGFLRSLLRAPRLWLPLARYALVLHWSSRIAQHRARRRGVEH